MHLLLLDCLAHIWEFFPVVWVHVIENVLHNCVCNYNFIIASELKALFCFLGVVIVVWSNVVCEHCQ